MPNQDLQAKLTPIVSKFIADLLAVTDQDKNENILEMGQWVFEDAPSWAQSAAVDGNGEAYLYSCRAEYLSFDPETEYWQGNKNVKEQQLEGFFSRWECCNSAINRDIRKGLYGYDWRIDAFFDADSKNKPVYAALRPATLPPHTTACRIDLNQTKQEADKKYMGMVFDMGDQQYFAEQVSKVYLQRMESQKRFYSPINAILPGAFLVGDVLVDTVFGSFCIYFEGAGKSAYDRCRTIYASEQQAFINFMKEQFCEQYNKIQHDAKSAV